MALERRLPIQNIAFSNQHLREPGIDSRVPAEKPMGEIIFLNERNQNARSEELASITDDIQVYAISLVAGDPGLSYDEALIQAENDLRLPNQISNDRYNAVLEAFDDEEAGAVSEQNDDIVVTSEELVEQQNPWKLRDKYTGRISGRQRRSSGIGTRY